MDPQNRRHHQPNALMTCGATQWESGGSYNWINQTLQPPPSFTEKKKGLKGRILPQDFMI